VSAVWQVFKEMTWSEVGTAITGVFGVITMAISNTILTLIQKLTVAVFGLIDKMRDYILEAMQRIVSILSTIGSSLGWFGGGISAGAKELHTYLGTMKNAKINTSDFVKSLESVKLTVDDVAPSFNDLGSRVETAFNIDHAESMGLWNSFMSSLLALTKQNAEARIREEERVQKYMEPNPDALRQAYDADPPSASDSSGSKPKGRKAELLNFLESFVSKNGLVGAKEALVAFNQTLDKTATSPDSFKTKTKAVETLNEGLTKTVKSTGDAKTEITGLGVIMEELQKSVNGLSFEKPSLSVLEFGKTALETLISVRDSNLRIGQGIMESQRITWASATTSVTDYANAAIARLNAVSQAAARANAAQLQSPISRFPGVIQSAAPTSNALLYSGTTLTRGFASGGYTGNVASGDIAGVVHGQEYVMPAKATAKYRPLLDAMRSGVNVSGGSGTVNPKMVVTIQNYGSSEHEVQQISANEVLIIAKNVVQREAPGAVARSLSNPNSVMSKSFKMNGRR